MYESDASGEAGCGAKSSSEVSWDGGGGSRASFLGFSLRRSLRFSSLVVGGLAVGAKRGRERRVEGALETDMEAGRTFSKIEAGFSASRLLLSRSSMAFILFRSFSFPGKKGKASWYILSALPSSPRTWCCFAISRNCSPSALPPSSLASIRCSRSSRRFCRSTGREGAGADDS